MPRKGKKAIAKRQKQQTALGVEPAKPEEAGGRVIERPDGFYWERAKGDLAGPYSTLAEAEADMLADGAAAEAEVPESLQEAESELGISEWIDPDTGGPAEDNVPRLEDH
jgi:hypothetical protein